MAHPIRLVRLGAEIVYVTQSVQHQSKNSALHIIKHLIRPQASVIQIMPHHFHISDGNEVAHNMARLLLLAQISILEASAVL
jgi:hypothetical protein